MSTRTSIVHSATRTKMRDSTPPPKAPLSLHEPLQTGTTLNNKNYREGTGPSGRTAFAHEAVSDFLCGKTGAAPSAGLSVRQDLFAAIDDWLNSRQLQEAITAPFSRALEL